MFVRGIWNSVSKTKQNCKHSTEFNTNTKAGETQNNVQNAVSFNSAPKSSSSKARRLRKMKLKSAKREEKDTGFSQDSQKTVIVEGHEVVHGNNCETVDIVIVMDEEGVGSAGGKIQNNENYYRENASDSKPSSVEVVEVIEKSSKQNKSNSKIKNNKNKGFSLSNIFNSKPAKNQNSGQQCSKDNSIQSTHTEESSKHKQTDETSHTEGTSTGTEGLFNENNGKFVVNERKQDSLPSSVHQQNSSVKNSSTIFTFTELNTNISNPTNLSSSSNDKTMNNVNESLETNEFNKENAGMFSLEEIQKKDNQLIVQQLSDIKTTEEQKSRPISIFVVPPDIVAEEGEAEGLNWESTSDLETSSQLSSSDDVRPETLVHLPSNDLQTSAVRKDGKNGIIQVEDYELSVIDLNSPLIAPDEEATLRTFLKTLNLTKPEEYDDTSSSKSYGDSSSTSMSEHSPIPPPPSDEIVVYRQVKSHSIAEPCYIPPRHHRFLDVITEETSDPSDSEKRNCAIRPWECSDMIRKTNDIDKIPNDWFGSDDEVDTTSEEGGIDTSWNNGKKLEDAEGVEVVYLSCTSDDDDSLNKLNGNITTINLPELVVVHAIERVDVKSTVKLQQSLNKKEPNVEDDSKIKSHALDDILAILDSTYEINKDLFTKQPLTGNKDYILGSREFTKDTNNTRECYLNTFNDILNTKEGINIATNADSFPYLNETSSEDFKPIYLNISSKTRPLGQETVVVTPPSLSRRGSSSSGTSQSTAKYNPGQSPTSSESDDKLNEDLLAKHGGRHTLNNPKSLLELSKDVITSLSHGDFLLKKLGFDNFEEKEILAENTNIISLNSLPQSELSTRRSSSYELDNIFSVHQSNYNHMPNHVMKDYFSTVPVFISSPLQSELTHVPINNEPWIGVPTSADPALIVCLSPSQSRNGTLTSSKEATELLDLHKKFVERRGYHEAENTKLMNSPKSEKNNSFDFTSPDVIKLEPYESKKVHTPELLKEAANLLALQEYRKSRFKSEVQLNPIKRPEVTCDNVTEGCVMEKIGDLSGVTSPRPKIVGDSGGPDSNRSAGTSRLLALLQCSTAPHYAPNNTVSSEMDRADKGDVTIVDRTQTYSGTYLAEWLTMSENVSFSSENCLNAGLIKRLGNVQAVSMKNISNSNIEKSKSEDVIGGRQFEADKYKISKQGDIAIIQTSEMSEKPPICSRKERPKSLPPTGIPALSPSGGELFREQMYHEYMNKVAERSERRQQKVIKISSLPISSSSKSDPEVDKTAQNTAPTNKLESEFMVKARERMSKLGINLDEEKADECPAEPLPKHLQEFMELTTPQADTASNAPGESFVHFACRTITPSMLWVSLISLALLLHTMIALETDCVDTKYCFCVVTVVLFVIIFVK